MLDDKTIKANIAANLTRLLDSRGWTQSDLSRASGETCMTISRLVRGEAMPHTGTIHRLAEALDTSIDLLAAAPPTADRKPRAKVAV